jgi:hypothetical protein
MGPRYGLQLATNNQGPEHSATRGRIHDVYPGEYPDTMVHFTPRGLASPLSTFQLRQGACADGNIQENRINQWINRHTAIILVVLFKL